MEYLPLAECKDRFLYRLNSRNLSLGVFNAKLQGFVGIRYKFDEYLDTEYHWDTGAPHGTAYPLEELRELPDEIELKENTPTEDSKTGRLVAFDKPVKDGGKGWYFLDTGESSQDIRPTSRTYQPLFDWLKEQEKQNAQNISSSNSNIAK